MLALSMISFLVGSHLMGNVDPIMVVSLATLRVLSIVEVAVLSRDGAATLLSIVALAAHLAARPTQLARILPLLLLQPPKSLF